MPRAYAYGVPGVVRNVEPVKALETTGVVSGDAQPLATLPEAAAYVDAEIDDALLPGMIETATQRVEGVLGLCGQWLRRATVTARFPLSTAGDHLEYELLGGRPTNTPTATVVGGARSATVTGTRTGVDGRTWVEVETSDAVDEGELVVVYEVGSLTDYPAVAKEAVLRLTAHLWANRDPAMDAKLDWNDLRELLGPVSVRTGFER